MLTVDFKGLCAFIGDGPTPATSKSVEVLMFRGEGSTPVLCRHDPVVLFQPSDPNQLGSPGFVQASSRTKHMSFQIHLPQLAANDRNQDIGVWNIAGQHLVLKGLTKPPGTSLSFDPTFKELLSLAQLTGASDRVEPNWLASNGLPNGVAARLTIDRGVLKGGTDISAGDWAFGKLKPANPPPGGWLIFRQSVRWEVDGVLTKPTDLVTLYAGHNNSASFQDPTHITVSNLCPLAPGIVGPSKDVLAYYAMAKDKVKTNNRLVLYRKPAANPVPPPPGIPSRPGMDACPPLWASRS